MRIYRIPGKYFNLGKKGGRDIPTFSQVWGWYNNIDFSTTKIKRDSISKNFSSASLTSKYVYEFCKMNNLMR